MPSFNKVILIGNLTADPELKTTQSGISVTSFSIGVSRRRPKDGSEAKTDFINIVAWRQQAEFITRYFTKGKPILVEGQLQTRSYDAQDGSKRYVTEVVADNVSFVESKAASASRQPEGAYYGAEPTAAPSANVTSASFEDVAAEDDLPF